MAITRYGAQRFSGLASDVNNLPLDADLIGAIFNSTDTLSFWFFNGTTWDPAAGGGGGITGLEPNSTILEYTQEIADYTTPTAATATSSVPTVQSYNEVGTPNAINISGGSGDGIRVGIQIPRKGNER